MMLALFAGPALAAPDAASAADPDLRALLQQLEQQAAAQEQALSRLRALVDGQAPAGGPDGTAASPDLWEDLTARISQRIDEVVLMGATASDLTAIEAFLNRPGLASATLVAFAGALASLVVGGLAWLMTRRALRLGGMPQVWPWLGAPLAALALLLAGLATVLLGTSLGLIPTITAAQPLAIALVLSTSVFVLLAPLILNPPPLPSFGATPLDPALIGRLRLSAFALVTIGLYGGALVWVAGKGVMEPAVQSVLAKLVAIIAAGLAVRLILGLRAPVATAIAGPPEAPGALTPLRQAAALAWTPAALFYVGAGTVFWVLDLNSVLENFVANSVGTVAIMVLLALGQAQIGRWRAAGPPLDATWVDRFPVLAARVRTYFRAAVVLAAIFAWGVGIVAIFTLWGADIVLWLLRQLAQTSLALLARVLAIVSFCVFAFEIVNIRIERFLNARDPETGKKIPRSARVRTLLPVLRTAFLVVLASVGALVVLSELGLDIAPLLAGAGVVGVALGFGAQAIVRDLLTGVFILLENTIEVGDLVEVAGHSGTVEALALRTIRMRDLSGVVHTVPYGEIAAVRNFSRDFSYAMFLIDVDKDQEANKVLAVLKEVGAELQANETHAKAILEPLDVMGVEGFSDFAMTIRVRIKCKPLRHIRIKRVFNLMMKQRFDRDGIRLATPRFLLPQPNEPTGVPEVAAAAS